MDGLPLHRLESGRPDRLLVDRILTMRTLAHVFVVMLVVGCTCGDASLRDVPPPTVPSNDAPPEKEGPDETEELEPCEIARTTLPAPAWVRHVALEPNGPNNEGVRGSRVTHESGVILSVYEYHGQVVAPPADVVDESGDGAQILVAETAPDTGDWGGTSDVRGSMSFYGETGPRFRPFSHFGGLLFGSLTVDGRFYPGSTSNPTTTCVGASIEYSAPRTFGRLYQLQTQHDLPFWAISGLSCSRVESEPTVCHGSYSGRNARLSVLDEDAALLTSHALPDTPDGGLNNLLAAFDDENRLLWRQTSNDATGRLGSAHTRRNDILALVNGKNGRAVWFDESYELPVGMNQAIFSIDPSHGAIRWIRPFALYKNGEFLPPDDTMLPPHLFASAAEGDRFCMNIVTNPVSQETNLYEFTFPTRTNEPMRVVMAEDGRYHSALVCFDEDGHADAKATFDLGPFGLSEERYTHVPDLPRLRVHRLDGRDFALTVAFNDAFVVTDSTGRTIEVSGQSAGLDAALVQIDDRARVTAVDSLSAPSNVRFDAATAIDDDIVVTGAFQSCLPLKTSDGDVQTLVQPTPSRLFFDGFIARFPNVRKRR